MTKNFGQNSKWKYETKNYQTGINKQPLFTCRKISHLVNCKKGYQVSSLGSSRPLRANFTNGMCWAQLWPYKSRGLLRSRQYAFTCSHTSSGIVCHMNIMDWTWPLLANVHYPRLMRGLWVHARYSQWGFRNLEWQRIILSPTKLNMIMVQKTERVLFYHLIWE